MQEERWQRHTQRARERGEGEREKFNESKEKARWGRIKREWTGPQKCEQSRNIGDTLSTRMMKGALFSVRRVSIAGTVDQLNWVLCTH